MQIKHKIDDFLFTIFPDIDRNDPSALIDKIKSYYTYGPYKPKVSIDKGWVIIEIDSPAILSQENDYRKAVSLCEKGNYSEAKPILSKLIQKNPAISEYHRIMGQVLSDEGQQDEAIDSLIDALRWDSKNGYALVMMGNILAKFKNDIPTAMKYYDQALVANPNDNITMNNIGANLMQQGKIEEAKKYFWEAVKINGEYPNTHYALGMIAEIENDFHSAFHSTIKAIKLNKKKDTLYNNFVKQAYDLANKIIDLNVAKTFINEFLHKLEFDGGKDIELIIDKNIPTAAKIEFAENYNREKHIIRYNTKYPAVSHLVAHELVHLKLVIDARKENLNQLFISNQEHKTRFIKNIEHTVKKLNKLGIPDDSIAQYCSGLFDGINRQVFNTPIDLFIEDFLYNEFSELRPYQFISLLALIQEGIKAVTDKKSVELSPQDILSKSKILNIVSALQFKEFYGLDFINDFKPTQAELQQAKEFYDEYIDYKDNKEPGEEYELVLHWAEDLKLDKFFELESEANYRKRSNVDTFIESLEKDPLGIHDEDPLREKEMQKFQNSQKEIGTNMAVVMFMVDALQYFEGMSKDNLNKIAVEIAMQGTQGYRPDKKDYKLSSIPDKVFSGYHILAYYYVSFALAMPEMLSELKLPYDNEYQLALNLFKNDKK